MSGDTAGSADRINAVLAVLARHGLAGCRAREASGGVLLLSGSAAHEVRLSDARAGTGELFAELRAAGFRYIALDLSPAAQTAP